MYVKQENKMKYMRNRVSDSDGQCSLRDGKLTVWVLGWSQLICLKRILRPVVQIEEPRQNLVDSLCWRDGAGIWRDQKSWSSGDRVPKDRELHGERVHRSEESSIWIFCRVLVGTRVWGKYLRLGKNHLRVSEGKVTGGHIELQMVLRVRWENLTIHRAQVRELRRVLPH